MPMRLREKIGEWSVPGTGLCIIALLLFITSAESPELSSTGPSEAAASPIAQPQPAPTGIAVRPRPAPSEKPAALAPMQSLAATAVERPAAASAPAQAPAALTNVMTATGSLSHDHHMQVIAAAPASPSETTGQASPAAGGGAAIAGGDPAAGRQVYRKCQACHSMEPGKNSLGPSLAGIIGRKAGSEAGYTYSPAMKQSNIVWDVKSLDAYLIDPAGTVPGNRMPFPGLKTENDRKDIIAFLASPGGASGNVSAAGPGAAALPPAASAAQPPAGQTQQQGAVNASVAYIPDTRYTLRSGIAEGRMVYLGVGGPIEGKVNPVLTAAEGQVVQLTLINGEGAEHDIVFPEQDARSPRVTGKGASTTLAFRAAKSGDFIYFCGVPGHRQAGMEGKFVVTPRATPQTVVEADVSREPDDLPPPVVTREPTTVHVDLLTVEVEGRLAEGTTFGYWTFNGKVPGPFLRVRVGDTIDIHLKNSTDSSMIHSVDFHAVTGPGGGAAALQVDPGHEKSMTWKALVPGLYVYHCATPMVAEHIANGMYGLILVEPVAGLPPVDREFYVMQGEIYTDVPYGQRGSAEFSVEKLLNERPEYFVFNGSVGALTKLHPLHAKVGETVRIFFGVGGPNYTSSFHVIGGIFDKVYTLGGVKTPPLEGIQTVTVPAGGAVITEFKLKVPGNYTLVDHALARAERGLLGVLSAEGAPNPEIYNGVVMPGMGH